MKITVLRLLGLGLASFVLSLVLTPLVRELNRRLGMVDRPDARRINKVPIPRGGGVAVFLSVAAVFFAFVAVSGDSVMSPLRLAGFPKLLALSAAVVALGYADDKWSLKPLAKLGGQLAVAFGAWAWAGVGFTHVFPAIPVWLDCAVTVFWIAGAINAFNLIDGLDGLASGLALIATVGMAGALVFSGSVGMVYFHAVFAGALLGFLRYNYNPASVFLGDSGSMFIGFVLAVMPLRFHTTNSFFVAVGVPVLAMGVPIFDTALAIVRRSIRHLLAKHGDLRDGTDRVMTADTDHLHHRILRSVGLSQRKAAWVLYGVACALVLFALGNVAFSSRRTVLWLVGLTVATAVVVRNFARIELYDAARLLGDLAHDPNYRNRRKYQRLAIPIYMLCDLLVVVGSYFAICWIVHKPLASDDYLLALPIRVFATLGSLVFFRAYVTIWPRAVVSNYVRLLLAAALGAVAGTVGIYLAPGVSLCRLRATLPLFALLPFFGFVAVRLIRPVLRDLFYALDCRRLMYRKDVSRMLVYGAGLRYAAFRRELVRSAAANRRIIVGLLDDDILLRGHYVGGIQIKGTINEAQSVINALNVDEVVITCVLDEQWRKVVLDILRPAGVRITHFKFGEEEIQ